MILDMEHHNRKHTENRLEDKLKCTKYSGLCTSSKLFVTCFAKKKKKKSFAVQSVIFAPKKIRNINKFLQNYAFSHPTREFSYKSLLNDFGILKRGC